MEVLAIIPARGGSKGIQGKNIYPLLGKPLIAYSIESALNSKLINRTIVSTDNEKIAEVSKEHGAEIPFMRPKELAEDDTKDLPVFQHTLKYLKEKENYQPDFVVHLWATSPLRVNGDIDKAIEKILKNQNADSIRSVTIPSKTPFKMWRGDKGEFLTPIMKQEFSDYYKKNLEPHTSPRQILPEVLTQTGYLSVIRYDTIMKKNSMQGEKILPFFHDEDLYTEFDTPKDIPYTEYALKKYSEKSR